MVFSIPVSISLSFGMKFLNFLVVTAPSAEGRIRPSCSSIRSEYLTLCCGKLERFESLMIPMGSYLIMVFKICKCRCKSSNSYSILPADVPKG
jgi:hypothetical protein